MKTEIRKNDTNPGRSLHSLPYLECPTEVEAGNGSSRWSQRKRPEELQKQIKHEYNNVLYDQEMYPRSASSFLSSSKETLQKISSCNTNLLLQTCNNC